MKLGRGLVRKKGHILAKNTTINFAYFTHFLKHLMHILFSNRKLNVFFFQIQMIKSHQKKIV